MYRGGVTVITPTGDRPNPFQLCSLFVGRQTQSPDQWIIIDDGISPTPPPSLPFVTYVRRERKDTDPKHTLPVQLLEAVQQVENEFVVIMEDDDWYSPTHIESMVNLFADGDDLVGQYPSIYYHVGVRRVQYPKNTNRASLCQTAFRNSLVGSVINICSNRKDPFVDLALWTSKGTKKKLSSISTCVGIKGMDGRPGSTIGWRVGGQYRPDPDLKVFRSLVGQDVSLYFNGEK